jgi:hypothetical protein
MGRGLTVTVADDDAVQLCALVTVTEYDVVVGGDTLIELVFALLLHV